MEDNQEEYDKGFYDGKEFARGSTPRVPNHKECLDLAQCFSENFDYDFEESWAIILRSFIAIFERYKAETGFVCKIACVQYETGSIYFDHYQWAGGICSLIERKV